jgi:hypothetical protein
MKIGGSASSFYNANNDSFNRANTTGSLGNSDRGLPWDNVRQTWQVLSNQAYTSATQNQYALAVGNIGLNNINARLSIPLDGSNPRAGAGIAFWVVDENNWYAVFPYYTQTTGTSCAGSASYCYSAGCTPSGCGGCAVINASYNTCTNCGSNTSGCPGGTCSCSSSTPSPTCEGTNATCSGAGCSPSNSCCTPVSEVITTTCDGPTSQCIDYTNTCTPSGCGSCSVSSVSLFTCAGGQVSCSSLSGNCTPPGSGGCYSSAGCAGTTYTSPYCDFGGQFVSWSAGACGTVSDQCFYPGQRFSVTCTTCISNTPITQYTRSCSTPRYAIDRSCTQWKYYSTTYNYCFNVLNYQYYCNPPVTVTSTLYNFTLIKMVNGVLSTIATYSCPSAILGLRVQTNNNSITVTGYSDVNLNTQTCQQTYTETSPNRGGKIGLLYGETVALGSSILDNFGVE